MRPRRGWDYSWSSPTWAARLRSSTPWVSCVVGFLHSSIRYSNPFTIYRKAHGIPRTVTSSGLGDEVRLEFQIVGLRHH